jgi:hypothetical protein
LDKRSIKSYHMRPAQIVFVVSKLQGGWSILVASPFHSIFLIKSDEILEYAIEMGILFQREKWK